jgi:hypothetical protein
VYFSGADFKRVFLGCRPDVDGFHATTGGAQIDAATRISQHNTAADTARFHQFRGALDRNVAILRTRVSCGDSLDRDVAVTSLHLHRRTGGNFHFNAGDRLTIHFRMSAAGSVENHHVYAICGARRVFHLVDPAEIDRSGIAGANANFILFPAAYLKRARSDAQRDDGLSVDSQDALNLFAGPGGGCLWC